MRPLSIAKHVGKVQVGCHQWLQRAVRHHGPDGGSPVAQGLTCAQQADAALVHPQCLGAEDDLVLFHELLSVGRAQELSHLDGPRLATFLALPAEPRAHNHQAAEESVPAEIWQDSADSAA